MFNRLSSTTCLGGNKCRCSFVQQLLVTSTERSRLSRDGRRRRRVVLYHTRRLFLVHAADLIGRQQAGRAAKVASTSTGDGSASEPSALPAGLETARCTVLHAGHAIDTRRRRFIQSREQNIAPRSSRRANEGQEKVFIERIALVWI